MSQAKDNQVSFECPLCHDQVTLHLTGGQHQFSYEGKCPGCEQYWDLNGEDGHEEEQSNHSLECPECSSTGKFVAEIGGHRPTFSLDDIDPNDPKHSLSEDLEIEKVTCWGCSHTDSFEHFYTPAT